MSITDKVIAKLIKKKITISLAESCTGGLISSTLTKYSGISKIFFTGIVSYSNAAKVRYLLVSKRTLKKFGAVSAETAIEMITGLYKKEKTQICISTTGVAGPTGGTKDKPVGLVYIGIKYNKKKYIYKKNFKGNRIDFQNKTNKFVFKKLNDLI